MGRKKPKLKLVGVDTELAERKVYVVPMSQWRSQHNYHDKPYMEWAASCGGKIVNSPAEADVLLFTGGTDISTSLYHQSMHWATQPPSVQRDRREIAMFLANRHKLKVGICRGAQLLNVLSGGSLIQHIQGNHHKSNHDVIDVRNKRVLGSVASTHHQMMLPAPSVSTREILLLAHNDKPRDQRYAYTLCDSWVQKEANPGVIKDSQRLLRFLGAYSNKDFKAHSQDLEAVYYHNTHSLCIQAHPENNRSGELFSNWCVNEIEQRLRNYRKKEA